jgi:hypothetical protein
MTEIPIQVGDDLWLEPLGWLTTVRTVEHADGELRITVSLPTDLDDELPDE